MLAPEGQYYNYSGCGNVVNCNHPVVRRFIVDCLRYWVQVGANCSFLADRGVAMLRVRVTATLPAKGSHPSAWVNWLQPGIRRAEGYVGKDVGDKAGGGAAI